MMTRIIDRKILSVAQAKARFSECVREAEEGRYVIIARHGKPAAALVAAEDLPALERLRAAGPQAGLASLAGGWKGSEELVASVASGRRTRARRPPSLS